MTEKANELNLEFLIPWPTKAKKKQKFVKLHKMTNAKNRKQKQRSEEKEK